MKFKTKIDWWAHIALGILPIFTIFMAVIFFVNRGTSGLAITIVIFLILDIFLIFPIWFNTYYTLDEKELLVKCGIWKPLKITYDSIKNVNESRSPLASSGLSLDRIEVIFGVGGVVLISPKNKQEFLQQLEQKRK